jgi:hypothetical protein
MKPRRELTEAEVSSLERFAKLHGRCWKQELRLAWMNGWGQGQNEPHLQQLRNEFGPTWLNNLRLSKGNAHV